MDGQSSGEIRAAGGIVEGAGVNRGKIAVVHRRRYQGEVGLPKGKVKQAETDADAAIREVEEETGLRAVLRQPVGTTRYQFEGKSKTVTYFLMDAPDGAQANPRDSAEIESVEWLTPVEAIVALTHAEDRRLIFKVFNIDLPQKEPARKPRIWDAPELTRLEGAIADFEVDLKYIAGARDEDWWLRAHQHLRRAKQYLDARNFHLGWIALLSSQRALLLNPGDPGRVHRTATALRHELSKITGWRAQTIKELICNDEGKLMPAISNSPMEVFDAVALRDDQFQTNYFKIMLRRWHLFSLFLLLVAAIVTTLLLSFIGALPDPFNNWGLMAGVVLFGTLGASLSVARGLLGADLSAKIPAQQIGSFVIWMRPAIGSAAALISYVLLTAKVFKFFEWDEKKTVIVFTVAIVAGFSERFIVGAIERLAESADKPEAGKKPGGGAKSESGQ